MIFTVIALVTAALFIMGQATVYNPVPKDGDVDVDEEA